MEKRRFHKATQVVTGTSSLLKKYHLLQTGTIFSLVANPFGRSGQPELGTNLDAVELTGNENIPSAKPPSLSTSTVKERAKLEFETEALSLIDWILSEKSIFQSDVINLAQSAKNSFSLTGAQGAKIPSDFPKQIFGALISYLDNQESRLSHRLDAVDPQKKKSQTEELHRMRRTLAYVAVRLLIQEEPWRKSSIDLASKTITELKQQGKEDAPAMQKRLSKRVSELSEAIRKDEKDLESNSNSFSRLHELGFVLPEEFQPKIVVPQMKNQLNQLNSFFQKNKQVKAAATMSGQIAKDLEKRENENDWAYVDRLRKLFEEAAASYDKIMRAKVEEKATTRKKVPPKNEKDTKK